MEEFYPKLKNNNISKKQSLKTKKDLMKKKQNRIKKG